MTTTNAQIAQDQISISEKDLSRKKDFAESLDQVSTAINQVLAWIAGLALLLMVFVVVGNGIFRSFYKPFAGATEVVGWLGAVSAAFGLGYTQVQRGYVEIDALVEHFPQAVQHILRGIILFICTGFCAMVSWQVVLYGLNIADNGNLSETMGIPFYPLIFLVALGFGALTLALLVDFLKQITGRC
ncbi:TRAP transporter small permease [Candidatus Formimonas warabiya]|uniref:C4-dicarboxylate ABC transporter permease n=1 Tax=Formimonas warabiya TaxID=1761012 RepID=A0A3G1KNR1_FORW1|nr:TRAP transporter small permease [Candidatus Formimonas warabiya]ATW24066.1 C4-dicarboxylate ABC transporter permease [Candidatus Formimonas warabiya]